MPPRRIPTQRPTSHKQSGRTRAVWTDPPAPATTGSCPARSAPRSPEAFARLTLELAASPTGAPPDPAGVTVAEVLLAYVNHAGRHYRGPDGEACQVRRCDIDTGGPSGSTGRSGTRETGEVRPG